MEYIILIPSILIAYGYWGLRKMCFTCFRWNGLKVISNVHSHSETRYRTKEQRTTLRDKNYNIVGYKDEPVQESYTVNYNQVTFECSKCHRQTQRTLRPYQYFIETAVVFILCYAILFSKVHPKEQKSESNNETVSNSYNGTNQSSSSHSSVTYDLSNKSKHQHKSNPINNNNSANQTSTDKDTTTNSESSTVAETEASNDVNVKKAIDMLKRDKSVGDIMDSTNLSRKEIRQIRRQLRNE